MPTARRYELVCWLAAAVLALTFAFMPAPTLGRPAEAIAASPTPAPHLVIYQQHCIERILTRALGKSDAVLAREIDRVCLAPFRKTPSAAVGLVASCGVGMPLVSAFRPLSGCAGR
jgi:hypothetical protein